MFSTLVHRTAECCLKVISIVCGCNHHAIILYCERMLMKQNHGQYLHVEWGTVVKKRVYIIY